MKQTFGLAEFIGCGLFCRVQKDGTLERLETPEVELWAFPMKPNLGVALADPSGIFSFIDTNAALFPMRFYRVLSP